MIDTTTKAGSAARPRTLERQWATDPRWRGIERPYSGEDVVRLRGSVRVEHTVARIGAERLWELLGTRDYIAALGAMTGGQAVEMLKAGPRGHLPLGLAGRRRREPLRPDVPGPVALPGELRPGRRPPAEQRADARGPDRVVRGPRHPAAPADRRGRRGRVRWRAERVRADAVDDRGRRRGRALRGSAREREEVRAPGRQGPGPDGAVRAHADRRAAGGRRARRPLARRGADRRARGHAAHVRHRRARRALHRPARARARASTGWKRAGRRDRARPGVRAVRGHAVVRDVDAGPGPGAGVRRGDPLGVPGQAARLQLLAVVQLEAAPRRRGDRAVPEGARGRWATGSSSSPWRGSTR